MTHEQKIDHLQAQLDALRAEMASKPKRPMSAEDIAYEMYESFDEKYYRGWVAFRHLIILRDAWGGGYGGDCNKYRIRANEINIYAISFPNSETRDEFQQQFADLIKTASPLLG
jgi:hypothetical protein